MDEIHSLTERVNELGRSVDRWNNVMIAGLAIAAVAAILVVVATRLVVVRAREQADAQGLLSAAKDRKLQEDLTQKEKDIAGLNKDAESLKHENLLLSEHVIELRKESEPRRLTGAQKDKLASILKSTKGGLTIVSPLTDGEASDYADDFDSAIHIGAGWETLRIKNRITEKFGVSIVTAEGTPPLSTLNLLDKALTAIGVPHDISTFKNDDGSISPHFQAGYLYLVIEHKPLPPTGARHSLSR